MKLRDSNPTKLRKSGAPYLRDIVAPDPIELVKVIGMIGTIIVKSGKIVGIQ